MNNFNYNNQYLNEENYQKNNKKVKKIGKYVMIFGLFIIIMGIAMAIISSTKTIPEMGQPGWFEASTAQSKQEFIGIALTMCGIFAIIWGAKIRLFMGNRREIMAYHTQQIMPIAQESIKSIAPTITEVGKDMATSIAPTMINISKDAASAMAPVYGEIAKEIVKGIKEGNIDIK